MSIDVKAVVKEVKDRIEANRKVIRERLEEGPPPPGLVPVTDEEFMAFVEAMMAQYPPESMTTPEGLTIVASPWFVMLGLPNVTGGKQIVDRVLRIQRKGLS